MLKEIAKTYKNNIHIANKVLFAILIILNIADIGFTYYGIHVLGVFGEGNKCYKDSVEAGNFIPIIIHKLIAIILLYLMIRYSVKKEKKVPKMKWITFVALEFLVLVYLITIVKWIYEILWYLIFYK